jgi:TolB protein
MNRLTITAAFCLVLSTAAMAGPVRLAFERDNAVWIADADGTHTRKIADGSSPDISSDGARLAFNTDAMSKTRPGPERHIAVADVASSKVQIMDKVPSDNCFGPVWSPDGNWLAFSVFADKEWQLGLIKADGSQFRIVKNAAGKGDAFGSPAWARDGQSIFCHDLDRIYQIDLNGVILKKWEIAKVLGDASMNSNDRLSVSPDGKSLLMDADTGPEHERKNWDGPQPATYVFDLAGETAKRVSGKADYLWDPCWLSHDEFLCIIQKEKENEPSIYRMTLKGQNPKLLVKKARTPSASR